MRRVEEIEAAIDACPRTTTAVSSNGFVRGFWDLFQALPSEVQDLAVKNYHLGRENPHHPSLRFRRLQGSQKRFSIRVGDHYRALGNLTDDEMIWVWIGTHSDYDRLLGS
jgi:hypothetical protein